MAETEIDLKAVLRDLLDVAKVALGPTMPDLALDDAGELLLRLLAVIDEAMPPEMQGRDPRVIKARILADYLKQ